MGQDRRSGPVRAAEREDKEQGHCQNKPCRLLFTGGKHKRGFPANEENHETPKTSQMRKISEVLRLRQAAAATNTGGNNTRIAEPRKVTSQSGAAGPGYEKKQTKPAPQNTREAQAHGRQQRQQDKGGKNIKLKCTARESDSCSARSPKGPATATTPGRRKERIPDRRCATRGFVAQTPRFRVPATLLRPKQDGGPRKEELEEVRRLDAPARQPFGMGIAVADPLHMDVRNPSQNRPE